GASRSAAPSTPLLKSARSRVTSWPVSSLIGIRLSWEVIQSYDESAISATDEPWGTPSARNGQPHLESRPDASQAPAIRRRRRLAVPGKPGGPVGPADLGPGLHHQRGAVG